MFKGEQVGHVAMQCSAIQAMLCRYRTQLCNDGERCRRHVCFFAHSLEELRVPPTKPFVSPEALAQASMEAARGPEPAPSTAVSLSVPITSQLYQSHPSMLPLTWTMCNRQSAARLLQLAFTCMLMDSALIREADG